MKYLGLFAGVYRVSYYFKFAYVTYINMKDLTYLLLKISLNLLTGMLFPIMLKLNLINSYHLNHQNIINVSDL